MIRGNLYDMAGSLVNTAVALFPGVVPLVRESREVGLQGRLEQRLHLFVQARWIALQCQDIVSLLFADLLGDRGLRAHRVDRHGRVFNVQQLQKFGDGRDLAQLFLTADFSSQPTFPRSRLLLAGDLPERQAVLARPGRDQVQHAPT